MKLYLSIVLTLAMIFSSVGVHAADEIGIPEDQSNSAVDRELAAEEADADENLASASNTLSVYDLTTTSPDGSISVTFSMSSLGGLQ